MYKIVEWWIQIAERYETLDWNSRNIHTVFRTNVQLLKSNLSKIFLTYQQIKHQTVQHQYVDPSQIRVQVHELNQQSNTYYQLLLSTIYQYQTQTRHQFDPDIDFSENPVKSNEVRQQALDNQLRAQEYLILSRQERQELNRNKMHKWLEQLTHLKETTQTQLAQLDDRQSLILDNDTNNKTLPLDSTPKLLEIGESSVETNSIR